MTTNIDLRSDHLPLLRPEDVAALVIQPVDRMSVAMQVSTILDTDASTMRIPIVTADVDAAWVAEGAEISEDSAATDELNVEPRKLAALTIISSELAQDSSPAAQQVVGQSIARDLARRIDLAYFGAQAGQSPNGLQDLLGVGIVDNVGSWANLDPFLEAQYAADAEGRELGAFVSDYSTALALAQLKDQTDSARPLLGDPLEGTRRRLAGVPLYVSPGVEAGVVWGLPRDVSMVVRRTGVQLAVDRSRYFERDSIGVRATMRLAFGWPHPAAVQRISLAAVESGSGV